MAADGLVAKRGAILDAFDILGRQRHGLGFS
jgi:hypothetical protein